MQREARLEGKGWVLDGTKNFCTNAPVAGTFVIMAVTDRAKGNRGISAFVVERGTPGLRIGKVEDKLGMRGSATSQVLLEDCRVPKENLLGELNHGFTNALKTLDGGRISIAALGVGIAQGAYEQAVSYAKQRKQFGKPIREFQAIQFMLADMALRTDAARMLTYRAAWLKDHEQPYKKEAAMAKLYASEAAMWVTTKAVQVHGGERQIKDNPGGRMFPEPELREDGGGGGEDPPLPIP